jgi:hypothetical protein
MTKAQQEALRKFAQAGGHGYGEFSYLSKPTARALTRMGLVRLGWRRATYGRGNIPWGVATQAGVEALGYGRTEAPYGFMPAPEGWLP